MYFYLKKAKKVKKIVLGQKWLKKPKKGLKSNFGIKTRPRKSENEIP